MKKKQLFQVGDRVVCVRGTRDNRRIKDQNGCVAVLLTRFVGVEFDNDVGGFGETDVYSFEVGHGAFVLPSGLRRI